ncbi:MAG: hypothetical protein AB2L14_23355 [Candidatus Xenobiia bacterium LiM19]
MKKYPRIKKELFFLNLCETLDTKFINLKRKSISPIIEIPAI